MLLGFIITLSLSWKKMVALHLFKRVEYELGYSLLIMQVELMIQSLDSILIAVACIVKEVYVVLFPYL